MADSFKKHENDIRSLFKYWAGDHKRAMESGERMWGQFKALFDTADDPHKQNNHLGAYEKFGKSNVPVILFMDIVGYSRLSFDKEQKAAIDLLNEIVRNALKRVDCAWDDVVCLPTGDGMCLCFITGPDVPLKVAAEVQIDLARKNRERTKGRRSRKEICVRMGIHSGHVLRIDDLKHSYNLAGSAISLAQRAMDCGGKGHILCTRDAYRQLTGIENEYKQKLRPISQPFIVKHGVRLKLYNYCDHNGVGNPKDPRT